MKYSCANCNGPVMKCGTGLGTWRCKKCPYVRYHTVTRFIGSGAENQKTRIEGVQVLRHVRVKRTKVDKQTA